VGRSRTVWRLGFELALQRGTVSIVHLDEAKHLTNVVQRRGSLFPGLSFDVDSRAESAAGRLHLKQTPRAGSAILATLRALVLVKSVLRRAAWFRGRPRD
jgi:hypothetical protein